MELEFITYNIKYIKRCFQLKNQDIAKIWNIDYTNVSKLINNPSKLTLGRLNALAEAVGLHFDEVINLNPIILKKSKKTNCQ